MTVVVGVLDQLVAVAWDAGVHELPDDAGKVGRHRNALQALSVLLKQGLIDVAQKLKKVFYRHLHVRDLQAVREIRVLIERIRVK